MNRKLLSTYILCAFLAVVTVQAEPTSARDSSVIVSVIRLLESPDQYVDRSIIVKGYLSNNPGLNLYVTKDHALINDIASKVHVSQDPGISESKCANTYVEIVGSFVRIGKSNFGIGHIEKISDAISDQVCWTARPINGDHGRSGTYF